MAFRIAPAVAKLLARMPASAKAQAQVANTGMDAMADAMNPLASPLFKEGTVVRAGPGTYDATVVIPGFAPVGCSIMARSASNLYGANDCTLPSVGSRVLVYLPNRNAGYGVIVGVIPSHDSVSVVPRNGGKPPQEYASVWELEAGATMAGNPGYSTPVESKDFLYTVRAGATRPLDVMPGVHAVVNDQQVGHSVSPLAVAMKATSRAQVRCSVVDESVRIAAGLFQFYGPDGTLQTFNDNGYVTEERTATPYQCERSGMNEIGEAVFEAKDKATLAPGSLFTTMQGVKARMVPRKRLHTLLGFMGDLLNIFVAKPDPDIGVPETQDAKSKDQGLFHTHVDASGRLHVRAANGILLERCDRIPVPKRLREPWDPEGDKDIQPPPPRKPYEFPSNHPYGRSMYMRDANAWRTLQAYWHIHNQSTGMGFKDYYLPEEQDLRVPDDKYDGPGKAEEQFKDNDKRRAAVAMEPDGSIIFRDAWGSEIVMRGGSIIISAAANVEVRAGKSIIGMGGQDVVLKARDSADITAERRDIRIRAGANLQASAYGVLVEAVGGSTVGLGKGEEARLGGVVIKATSGTAMVTGKVAQVSAPLVLMDTFGGSDGSDDESNKGAVMISAGQIRANAEIMATVNVGKDTGLELVNGTAAVVAPNLLLAGVNGTTVMKGSDIMVPLKWVPAEGDIYAAIQDRLQSQWSELSEAGKAEWLAPFPPSVRSQLIFTYRSSAEYGTVSAAELDGPAFYIYQPAWAFMAQHGAETVKAALAGWQEAAVAETYPWPGADKRGDCYVTLMKEVNVDSATGLSKPRKDLLPGSGLYERKSMDELEVIPQ